MSSFIGHSLAGFTTYALTQQFQIDRPHRKNQYHWTWLIWLLIVASLPDIDYLIPGLRVQHTNLFLRITHSFFGALLIPSCTILGLWLLGNRGRNYNLKSLQVILAGISHLLLDLLTGVSPLPLLYPLSTQPFKLPFGLLPSAGKIELSNYFFYRNLLIELGVLVPLAVSLSLSLQPSAQSSQHRWVIGLGLMMISIGFMIWAFTLSR